MQVVVNSLLTTYSRQDKTKKTILFLHGWGDSKETFKAVAQELGKKYSVIVLDLPGFGGTQKPAEPWGLKEYAVFVRDFLRKIGDPKLYAIVGHSNGGAIAIEGLADGVFTAERLVLVASAGVRNTSGQQAHRRIWQAIAKGGKAATVLLPRVTREKLRRKLYGAAGSDMLIAEDMQETFKRVVQQDVLDKAARVDAPTLLIYGAADTATPPAYGQALHSVITKSELKIVPDADHFVHQHQAPLIAGQIEEFLQ